ncbi:MAG TPA: tetratricopeptide repeat protein [Pyrinomonadaceae bacterium]|nr:tetratricopeptide repeat protein [Pyrinomonadaceae bacterium]
MTNMQDQQSRNSFFRAGRQTVALSLIILLGLAGVVGLSRWMEAHRPPVDPNLEEEQLYVTGATTRRLSLSFSGLVADWYWMRSLQYVGRKLVRVEDNENLQGQKIELTENEFFNLKMLPALLDATTTLDPQFMVAYEYGAVMLPLIKKDDEAIALLKKGMAANPTSWKLAHHLGYIYWQRGDYRAASETYDAGAKLPDAPPWLAALSARMLAQGGSRQLAREMYGRIYDQSDDNQVKEMAVRHIMQIDADDERDTIRRILSEYSAHHAGRCATSWKDVYAGLRASRLKLDAATSAPLDPSETPYRLVKDGCDVDLDLQSQVPRK